jgi:excisionase family DNA binding protein
MDGEPSLDVVAIASRVLEALDRLSFTALPADEKRGGAQLSTRVSGTEDLAARLEELIREVERCRLMQQRLENALAQVQQQMWLLPAYLIRLEQWSIAAEARLTQLAPGNGAPALASGQEPKAVRWATVKEVARYLGLSPSTVRRYIRKGILPAARLPGGRGLRIRWEDVQARVSEGGLTLH